MSSEKPFWQFAVPEYVRIGRNGVAVIVDAAVAILKLRKRADRANFGGVIFCTDSKKHEILKLLTSVFDDNQPILSQMTHEISQLLFNLSIFDKRKITSVSPTERRKMCQELAPRLQSIAGHARTLRLEYEALCAEYELGSIVFDSEILWFEEWGAQSVNEIEALPKAMKEYLELLDGDYDLAELEASPQATKKTRRDDPE